MNEYELLRAEIIESFNMIVSYENILYTVVAAILVFSLESGNYLLCLVPYIVIVPMFFIVMSKKIGICKISTYMFVFLEGEQYHWERRQCQYDPIDSNETTLQNHLFHYPWKTHLQYYLTASACSAVAIYEIYCSDFDYTGKWVRSIVVASLTLFVLVLINMNTFIWSEQKRDMISRWTAVKEAEEAAQTAASQPIQEANHGNESGVQT